MIMKEEFTYKSDQVEYAQKLKSLGYRVSLGETEERISAYDTGTVYQVYVHDTLKWSPSTLIFYKIVGDKKEYLSGIDSNGFLFSSDQEKAIVTEYDNSFLDRFALEDLGIEYAISSGVLLPKH